MPAFCELTQLGLVSFTGDDAQGFLHAQLTCDVTALPVNRSVYGAYCTPKGRMLATFLLWRTAEGYFMQLPAALRETIQKRLSMYVLRAKVKVEDAGPRFTIAGLAGEGAASHVERILGAAPEQHGVVTAAHGMAIGLPRDRYEVVLPRAGAPATLSKLAEDAQAMEPAHWDWLELRAGVPTITEPTREAFVPQMANLDLIGGLSFSKGCYPGQEIVARMHFLGKLKQRMFLAHLAGGPAEAPPQAGDKLYSADLGSQSSGTVVNAAPSPQGGYDMLAVMQIASAAGQPMHWKSADGPVLELLPLPYEVTTEP
jgi:tRNA-modifying protein YgfZ